MSCSLPVWTGLALAPRRMHLDDLMTSRPTRITMRADCRKLCGPAEASEAWV
jgi:hypothetical protein